MKKKLNIAIIIVAILFVIDQAVKYGFAHFDWNVEGPYMSLQLAYNYGVAFSMFSFLAEYLKYIQLTIVLGASIYLFNILDRFTYGGVVDYFYWHYGFEFAIFNLADVIIDTAVVIIIYMQIKQSRKEKKENK